MVLKVCPCSSQHVLTILTDNPGYCCPSSGLRKFKAAYKQALALEQKTILGLNTLLGNLASWVVATDSLRDESPPAVVTLRQLREQSHAWAVTRDSVRAALASLTSEPAQWLYSITALLQWPCRGPDLG